MNRARGWWLGFGVFAAFLVAGVIHISRVTLNLEDMNRVAAAEAEQRERLRDALWTLDGWLGQILDDEAKRAVGEGWFQPLSGQQHASPLVTENRPLFISRFESNPTGPPTLCQTVPDAFTNGPSLQQLAVVKDWVDNNDLDQAFDTAAAQTCAQMETSNTVVQSLDTFGGMSQQNGQSPPSPLAPTQTDASPPGQSYSSNSSYGNPQRIDIESQNRRNQVSMKSRSQRSQNFEAADINGILEPTPPEIGDTGVLLPYWQDDGDGMQLMFLRRVYRQGELLVQGLTVDWPVLEEELFSLANPIIEGLAFEPLTGASIGDKQWVGCSLGALPLGLVLPPVSLGKIEGLSSARIALSLTWFAVLGAIAIAFMSLRSSIAFGERRSRFASAVTHELRTPLTTFQLYSEMLADGMVEDPAQRQEYLETLRVESQRLSGLVESVLAYSRLEEGREQRRRETVTVDEILERGRARHERTLDDAGLSLEVEVEDGATALFTDADAVGQILTNLVENAAKYSAGSDPAAVVITAKRRGGPIEITVRDHGPGIAPECRGRIFAPFDRAGRESGNLPGAGLGLSIARALARDLGGDLRLLESAPGSGAQFVLSLPAAPGR